jgi:hypothetical protein
MNAIYDTIGVRMTSLSASPEWVREAIYAKERNMVYHAAK